jgi:hypothetical protein
MLKQLNYGQPQLDRQVLKDPSWLHWAATLPLLVASLVGISWAIPAAMLLCMAAGGYYYSLLRQVRPFPVQVRIAYFALLAAGMVPYMQWLHWIQLVGTTAMVTFGYCPLIRMLSLAPWNRNQPFTRALAVEILFRQPCSGGLLNWQPTTEGCGASCSLAPRAASCSAKVSGREFAAP